MRSALLGALLMVAGVAAQIVARRHRPIPGSDATFGAASGWPTTYDLMRIGGWALLIFGAVTVAFALARETRRPR
jgi:hypothetical protein